MNFLKSTVLLLALCLTMTSCKVMKGIYGVKPIEPVDQKTVLKYCDKYDIPEENCYMVDTSYLSYLNSLDSIESQCQVSNHYQPLQALYYNKNGDLQSFQISTFAGGFPNLKWNKDHIFSTFPPKEQASLGTILPVDRHLEFLKPISKINDLNNYDYLVIVHWNRFMGRQSKRLIKLVKKNAELTDKKVQIIYVNNDNLYALGKPNVQLVFGS